MALSDAYATSDEYLATLGWPANAARADVINGALVAASRIIDRGTGNRQFGLADAASTRTFPVVRTARGVFIDDLSAAPTAVTLTPAGGSAVTLTVDAYHLQPRNALAFEAAYYELWLAARPDAGSVIEVTGVWGWPGDTCTYPASHVGCCPSASA